MKKTFKQLLKQYPTFTNDKCYGETCVLEMLKLVREKLEDKYKIIENLGNISLLTYQNAFL